MIARRAWTIVSALLVVLGPGLAPVSAQPASIDRPLRGQELVQALRAGGYVVYLRHATTEPEQADTDTTNFVRCETQRNLSEAGRKMARDIGQAFRSLGIRVGTVLSSPYCRTVQTAKLAFGRAERSDALFFAMGASADTRARQGELLRRMLGTPPAPGTNTVIVSHNANLKEAINIWPRREGDAHVFRPRAGGGFDHVAEVRAEEWTQLARDKAEGPAAASAGTAPAR